MNSGKNKIYIMSFILMVIAFLILTSCNMSHSDHSSQSVLGTSVVREEPQNETIYEIALSDGFPIDYTDSQFAEASGIHPVTSITKNDIYSVAKQFSYESYNVFFYLRNPYYVSAAVETPDNKYYRIYEGGVYSGGVFGIESYEGLFGYDGFLLYYETENKPVRDYYYFEHGTPKLLLHCAGNTFVEDFDGDGLKEVLCFEDGDPTGNLAINAHYYYMYNDTLSGILPEYHVNQKMRLFREIRREDLMTIYYCFEENPSKDLRLFLHGSGEPVSTMIKGKMSFTPDSIVFSLNE